jgi:predicted O-methyltransferase YrrM
MTVMKKLRALLLPILDALLSPLVFLEAWSLKHIRQVGMRKLPKCKKALLRAGAFPIRNHYYEPQFDYRKIRQPFSQERPLPGINWNVEGQLEMLETFSFSNELTDLGQEPADPLDYRLQNILFGPGDAEYWYQLIRLKKPRRIFEIGSGNSTLIAMKALNKNRQENPEYSCKHICIEPYERPWLEKAGAVVVRRKVEDIGVDFFSELQENDLLFIDSSHVIRPQGDVLFEYLELLPTLNKGVIVQIHDIFSPRNYRKEFIVDNITFWNEQYLLEGFLSENASWEIVGALNYLYCDHWEKLKSVAPFLTPASQPSSFYIRRIR